MLLIFICLILSNPNTRCLCARSNTLLGNSRQTICIQYTLSSRARLALWLPLGRVRVRAKVSCMQADNIRINYRHSHKTKESKLTNKL